MQLVLIRHGETEWSRTRRHTGRSDIPLTDVGRAEARVLLGALAGEFAFARVLSSPLARARETCELAGLGDRAEIEEALVEWDYGEYEGITTKEIRATRPGWSLWRDGCPGGESANDVGARVDLLLEALRAGPADGDVALFAHGHLLRVLAARWLGLPPSSGALFALSVATLSVLGYERETAVITRWNAPVA
jgi:broad specificity phosphatase PhoE